MGEPSGYMQTMPLRLPYICTGPTGAHHPALRIPALWAGLLQCFQACLLHDPPYSCGGVLIDLLQIVCSTSASCVWWSSMVLHARCQAGELPCQVSPAAVAPKLHAGHCVRQCMLPSEAASLESSTGWLALAAAQTFWLLRSVPVAKSTELPPQHHSRKWQPLERAQP